MFNLEEKGLQLLRETRTVHVPKTAGSSEADDWQFILMEYIESGISNKQSWSALGRQLALLHRHTHPNFGLDHNNYIGALHQQNTFTKGWTDFFIENRIVPQLNLLVTSNKVDAKFTEELESLYLKFNELMPSEPPSLLHGDLWRGNVIVGKSGPILIDPAVYYGHREAELSFTTLFGGFDDAFYEAYSSHFPLQPGFNERVDLYNLYPLLVHANLFGQSYLSGISSIVKKYR